MRRPQPVVAAITNAIRRALASKCWCRRGRAQPAARVGGKKLGKDSARRLKRTLAFGGRRLGVRSGQRDDQRAEDDSQRSRGLHVHPPILMSESKASPGPRQPRRCAAARTLRHGSGTRVKCTPVGGLFVTQNSESFSSSVRTPIGRRTSLRLERGPNDDDPLCFCPPGSWKRRSL
jgi:hypothetical protein